MQNKLHHLHFMTLNRVSQGDTIRGLIEQLIRNILKVFKIYPHTVKGPIT